MSSQKEIERDYALVTNAQARPEEFGKLFDLYYSKILSYALKRLGEAEVAQDITAETFIKAFRALPHYKFQNIPFSSWLYKIAGNEIKMHFRRPKRFASLEALREDGFDTPELLNERELLNELLARDEEFRFVMEAVRKLKVRYQEAIVLRYIEDKEIAQIAIIMNCKEGTVRSLLSRGISQVREILEKPMQQKTLERIIESEGRSVLSILKQN